MKDYTSIRLFVEFVLWSMFLVIQKGFINDTGPALKELAGETYPFIFLCVSCLR